MLFCPKCGSILKPKKSENRKVMACSCGFVDRKPEGRITETVKTHEKEIEVREKTDIEAMPKVETECLKCRNTKAYYWFVHTRAADEAPTKFFRCDKCGHTWREYD